MGENNGRNNGSRFGKGNTAGKAPKKGKGTGRKPCPVHQLRAELVNDPKGIRKSWARLCELCESDDEEIAFKANKYRLSLVFPEMKEVGLNVESLPEPFVVNFPQGVSLLDLIPEIGDAEQETG